ncbi:acetyltransferase [Bacillus sp. BRMEA1]|nr:acetyltransferase [Neobacillus endophyticus]
MHEKLLLIGGGGHCSSVIDVLQENNSFDEIGIIDTKEKIGMKFCSLTYIGSDDDLKELYNQGYSSAFITVGSVINPMLRIKLYKLIYDIGFNIPNIISNTAIISNSSTFGNGIFVGKGAIINARTFIGNGSILNTGCIIEHDCRIGEFVHIAPGTTLSGGVIIGNKSHIGTNSTIIQGINIGENTLIGAGSVVVNNIGNGKKAFGNPCKELKDE